MFVFLFASLIRLLAFGKATAVANLLDGSVTEIIVTDPGSGYTTEPTVTITGGGGAGATAKAVIQADKVIAIIVTSPGSGYTSYPSVTVARPLGIALLLLPEISVLGPAGTSARIESADSIHGPWTAWTNVVLERNNPVFDDLRPGARERFYRAFATGASGTTSGGVETLELARTEGGLAVFGEPNLGEPPLMSSPRSLGVKVRNVTRRVPAVAPDGFVWIPAGTFKMGSSDFYDARPQQVTLTQGFWMADHEVTQAEYKDVMGANPSIYTGADRPVENVTWRNAVDYCLRLTERNLAAGRIKPQQAYRLPTVAEWEYAARAGTALELYGPLSQIAWWFGNSSQGTHSVRKKTPNAWGLYDMLGNVEEWTFDGISYTIGDVTDPFYPYPDFIMPVAVRGGSFSSEASEVRASRRSSVWPSSDRVGFRVVLDSDRSGILPPTITVQPSSVGVSAGRSARFGVVAYGSGEFSYQWEFNGVSIPGSTNAALQISNVQPSNIGGYRVVVSNPGGVVTSVVAALWLNATNTVDEAGFVWIPPGTFVMGSPATELGRSPAEIAHTVTLTHGFWICDHEVTQGEYKDVLGISPARFSGDHRPVENVSWFDAVKYCQRRTEKERAEGRITGLLAYRLPTEAEWEYAARAGATGSWYGAWAHTAWLDAIAWWGILSPWPVPWYGNASGVTHDVKGKAPNAWGLYDTLGNVSEWCADWHGDYTSRSVVNPAGPGSGEDRVFRGGGQLSSFSIDAVRLAARGRGYPYSRSESVGFRVVLSEAE